MNKNKMDEINLATSNLFNELKENKDIYQYIRKYEDQFPSMDLQCYISECILNSSKKKSQIIRDSDINRQYAYEIFNGTKMPSRDKLIALSLAMELSLDGTQKMLTLGNHNPLYPKNSWDSIIIYAVHTKLTVTKCNLLLDELGQGPLM